MISSSQHLMCSYSMSRLESSLLSRRSQCAAVLPPLMLVLNCLWPLLWDVYAILSRLLTLSQKCTTKARKTLKHKWLSSINGGKTSCWVNKCLIQYLAFTGQCLHSDIKRFKLMEHKLKTCI